MRNMLERFNKWVATPLGWLTIILAIAFAVWSNWPRHNGHGWRCLTPHMARRMEAGQHGMPTYAEARAVCEAYPNEKVCRAFVDKEVDHWEVMDCFGKGNEEPNGNQYCPRLPVFPVDELDAKVQDSAADLLSDPVVQEFAGKITAEEFARLYRAARYFLDNYVARKIARGGSEDDDLFIDLAREMKRDLEEAMAPYTVHLPQPSVSDEAAFKQFAGLALGAYRETLALMRQRNAGLLAELGPECEGFRGQTYQPARCIALATLNKP